MKSLITILMACGVLLLASCGEGIKKRQVASKASDIVLRDATVKPKGTVFDEYHLQFWKNYQANTSKKIASAPPRLGVSAMSSHHAPDSSCLSAYRLGYVFGSDNGSNVSERLGLVRALAPELLRGDSSQVEKANPERFFLNCVSSMEKKDKYGYVGLLVSGYYFSKLAMVLEQRDADNIRPTMKAVNHAMDELGNLNNFLNDCLKSDKSDVAVSRTILKVQERLKELETLYYYTPYTRGTSERIDALYDAVKDIPSAFDEI